MGEFGLIDEIVEDLMRHASRLRSDADRADHPLERADLLERAREFEQMASAADEQQGWSPKQDRFAPQTTTELPVLSQVDREESRDEIGVAGEPLLVAA